jgi:hypothetical protein
MIEFHDEHIPGDGQEAAVSRGGRWFAAGLAAVGTALLIDRTVPAVNLPSFAARWWPLALLALGVVGVVRLLPTANALIGPLLLVTAGGLALLFTLQPFPDWARPLIVPVLLLASGIGLLLAGQPGRPRTIGGGLARREFVVLGRPLEWNPAEHPMLELRVLTGGCELTVLPPPARTGDEPAPRLEIRSALSGIDVVVPHGLKVHVSARGPGLRVGATGSPPDTADVKIVMLSAFTSLRVKTSV